MSSRAALETLGCKVNQYESSYFLEELHRAGFESVPFRERADVYIVHSCAVTSKASYQTRQLLRRARRINPEALIVAAGCAAQLEADRFAAEGLATHILGNAEKFGLLSWLETPGAFSSPCRAISDSRQYRECPSLPVGRMHSGRARAALKIQDGCDTFCSYCIVPYTRGKSRSLPRDQVRLQLDRFLDFGYREVVLTGIHLGQWGKDLQPAQDLASLLSSLSEGSLPSRVRLSSLEPMEWTRQLMGSLPRWPWICPHYHVPLQSGDAGTLQRMGRPYTPKQYAELINELNFLSPFAAIGADVMAGFPGETEEDFQNSCNLIQSLPLAYLHVFPFSPRPGTPASEWTGRATGAELKRRTGILQKLGMEKKRAFQERSVGTCVQVLVERELKRGWWQGTSENYLQVIFPSERPQAPGALATVRLSGRTEAGLAGELLHIRGEG